MRKTERIDKFLSDNKISKTKCCEMCHISKKVLDRLYSENYNIRLRCLNNC